MSKGRPFLKWAAFTHTAFLGDFQLIIVFCFFIGDTFKQKNQQYLQYGIYVGFSKKAKTNEREFRLEWLVFLSVEKKKFCGTNRF